MNLKTLYSIKKNSDTKIQSKKLKTGTYEIIKISLSCFDNKRFVSDDETDTLAHFYKDLRK